MIYLDSSALVTLLSRRTYAEDLRQFLSGRPAMPMATSTLGFVETVRTMDRVGEPERKDFRSKLRASWIRSLG